MKEVLSQHEIDALVNNLALGQIDSDNISVLEPKERIKVYDFKRPNKFSKEQISFLSNIHENYCRAIKTYFTSCLHSAIGTKILSVEQITYDEFTRSLPNPTVLGVYSLKPLEGMFLMEISPALSFTMIDRLLGGVGTENKQNRDLTEIEKSVIEKRMEYMIALFKEAWAEVYEVTPQFVTLETNPQFIQIVAPNEMVALVTVEIVIGGIYGMLNICLPFMVLEPIMDKLSTAFLFSSQAKQNSAEDIKRIQKKIEGVKVDVVVLLGRTEILVRDLLELLPGDVIPLAQGIHEQLPVNVGPFLKFGGIPGLSGKNLALQITEVFTEEGDDNG